MSTAAAPAADATTLVLVSAGFGVLSSVAALVTSWHARNRSSR